MPDSSKPIAMRDSWKILPMPEQRATLSFTESYDAQDFDRIKAGWIPVAMEDKWFIFFEDPWLFIHRGWTGVCIYAVRFDHSPEGATAVEAWVNRDETQYRETRAGRDRRILKRLIGSMLPERPAGLHTTNPGSARTWWRSLRNRLRE